MIAAYKRGEWSETDGTVVVGGVQLEPGEYEFRLVSGAEGAAATLAGHRGIVVLDTDVTPELEAEGVARDLVRQVQQARRQAGLAVSDRIRLEIEAPAPVVAAFETYRELVTGETLAVEASAVEADVSEPRIVVTRVTTG